MCHVTIFRSLEHCFISVKYACLLVTNLLTLMSVEGEIVNIKVNIGFFGLFGLRVLTT